MRERFGAGCIRVRMGGGSWAATGLTNTDVRILAVDPCIDNTSSGAVESSLVNITGDLTSSLGNRVTANALD